MPHEWMQNRIKAKVREVEGPLDTPCWMWLGKWKNNGYGSITEEGKEWLTHRYSYEAFIGDIPEGILVRHRCNNRYCANPDHLALGYELANHQDSVEAGTFKPPPHYSGRAHPRAMAKLREREVHQVRMMIWEGIKQMDIAEHFHVSPQTITDLKKGRVWAHVWTCPRAQDLEWLDGEGELICSGATPHSDGGKTAFKRRV